MLLHVEQLLKHRLVLALRVHARPHLVA